MPATQKSLKIEQGATFSLVFTWYSAGPVVDGEVTPGDPHDLTGWSAHMQIRKKQQTDVLVDASTDNGRITLGADGKVQIVLTDEDTDLLTSKKAKYDLEVEDPDGNVYRLLEGEVVVSPNITQDADDPVVGA